MTDAYIYDAVRTPRGKGRKDGSLHEVTPVRLAVTALQAIRDRNKLDTQLVDDVVLGCVMPIGEQGADIARTASVMAGYAETVSGVQVNRFCASGLEATNMAAAQVMSGQSQAAIGGGVESMSQSPYVVKAMRWGKRMGDEAMIDAMEAILGAAFLDGDLKAVRKIFQTLFVAQIEIHPEDNWGDNPKGHLQVLAQQRWKTNPNYRLVKQEGPPHARVFTVEVAIAGKVSGTGQGACKRDAQQSAARQALREMQEEDRRRPAHRSPALPGEGGMPDARPETTTSDRVRPPAGKGT